MPGQMTMKHQIKEDEIISMQHTFSKLIKITNPTPFSNLDSKFNKIKGQKEYSETEDQFSL